MTRAEATRKAGMERLALRDAMICQDVEGLAELGRRPKPERFFGASRGAAEQGLELGEHLLDRVQVGRVFPVEIGLAS